MKTKPDAANDNGGECAAGAAQACAAQMEEALLDFIIEWVPRVGYVRAVALAQTATSLLISSNIAKMSPVDDGGECAEEYLNALGKAAMSVLPAMREALAKARANPDNIRRMLGVVARDVAPLFLRPTPDSEQN